MKLVQKWLTANLSHFALVHLKERKKRIQKDSLWNETRTPSGDRVSRGHVALCADFW